jgi:hypothetical protein
VQTSTPVGHALDIADDTFVVASPGAVADLVHDPACWRRWWPDLVPTVTRDRGLAGLKWSVRGAALGIMEIWLEPWADGVVVHWFLCAEPARVRRRPERERAERVLRWKREVFALKDLLEAGREPGSPRAGLGAGAVKERAEPAEPI